MRMDNHQDLINSLKRIVEYKNIYIDESMKDHTTFRIGGPADFLVTPESQDQLVRLLELITNYSIPYTVIGGGSNLLVRDGGIRGIVIKLGEGFSSVTIDGPLVTAQSGVSLPALVRMLAENGLSGLEFAEGIPGHLGGAVYMNAGAYGGEISQVLKSVRVIDDLGRISTIDSKDMVFGYRMTSIQQDRQIVIGADLLLQPDKVIDIQNRILEFARLRKEKQPSGLPSAGSVFKRPPGHFVGPMIERLGLKGHRIGDAEISTKHAGFIVNRGQASASDVLSLIDYVSQAVADAYGITLEIEPRIVGED